MQPVLYPSPPPTTNNLSTNQRSLLLRKAKKIEQILGYPPHLIEGTAARRSSLDSASSTTLIDENDVSWFCYRRNPPNHKKGTTHIPLLRAASKSLRFQLVAVTNWPSEHPRSPSDSDQPSPTDPLMPAPSFTIPTSHTHRKAKMDTIRKRLGSEVPCAVVFPDPSDKPSPTRLRAHHQRHLVRKERLSLIPESPDEQPSQAPDSSRGRDTAYSSSTYSQHSDPGVMSVRKHLSSYRKPPPPLLDDSVCSF